jgi:hypothetical protein
MAGIKTFFIVKALKAVSTNWQELCSLKEHGFHPEGIAYVIPYTINLCEKLEKSNVYPKLFQTFLIKGKFASYEYRISKVSGPTVLPTSLDASKTFLLWNIIELRRTVCTSFHNEISSVRIKDRYFAPMIFKIVI